MFHNRKIFITGGTGTFGKRFISKILSQYKPKKITVFSRDEHKQYEMKNLDFFKYHSNRLRFFIGDVRDSERLNLAMSNGYDFVVHAAALKHIDIAEYNPFEAVKTNILGTNNVIDSSIKNKVKKIVALSTDKAVSPKNLYGATKLVLEKIVNAANNYNDTNKIAFSCVRYGNVMGSRGSVIPKFLEKKNTGKLPLTNIKSTRFNIETDDAVEFVIKSFELMLGGEIFVPKMKSYRLIDLAKSISKKSKIVETGLRPGEKLHESLISEEELLNTFEFKDFFVVAPNSEYNLWNIKKFLKKNKLKQKYKKPKSEYNSFNNKSYLSMTELKNLIKKFD